MKLLLDTHIFLWYITNDQHLNSGLASAIRNESNEVYLSAVSIWEALVKHQGGRLNLPSPADGYLQEKQKQHRIVSLPRKLELLLRFLSFRQFIAIHSTACWSARQFIMALSWQR